MLVVVSGPSGVGKSFFIRGALERHGFTTLTPYTTRAPRPSEEGGRDFHFVSKESFQRELRSGGFFDWDYAFGNYYGYGLELGEASDRLAIIPVLSRMAVRLLPRVSDVFLLFLDGSDRVLEKRLRDRGIDGEELAVRLHEIREARDHSPMFHRREVSAGSFSLADVARVVEDIRRTEH